MIKKIFSVLILGLLYLVSLLPFRVIYLIADSIYLILYYVTRQLFNEKRIIVYKPLSNNFFNNVIMQMRSRFGAMLVDMKSTMRETPRIPQ